MIKRYGIILTIIYSLIAACAPLQDVKSPNEMTPKEVAVWANRQYEQQYTAYLQDYELGMNNSVMREALKKKRQILLEVYPSLLVFNEYINSGTLPPEEMTNNIINLIYKLTGVY